MAELFCKFGTLEVGVNSDGNLYIGDECSGYNLPDTPANREYLMTEFVSIVTGYEPFKRKKLLKILKKEGII